MNCVNLTGIIRNSASAILGQNVVGFANLDMGKSTISILSMAGSLPEDGTKIEIRGQSTNHIYVVSSPSVHSDGSVSNYEVRHTDKPSQAWTLVFDWQKVCDESDVNTEEDFNEFTPFPKNAPLTGTITGFGEDFIELNGEKYTYTDKAKVALSITLILYKQIQIYWNFAKDGSGEKLCFGVYAVKKEKEQSGTNQNGGGSGLSGNSDKQKKKDNSVELNEVTVTGRTEKGIFINDLFFTKTRYTKGNMPQKGDVVNAKVSSTDPSDGVMRYLLSVYPVQQEQTA